MELERLLLLSDGCEEVHFVNIIFMMWTKYYPCLRINFLKETIIDVLMITLLFILLNDAYIIRL